MGAWGAVNAAPLFNCSWFACTTCSGGLLPRVGLCRAEPIMQLENGGVLCLEYGETSWCSQS